MAVNLLHLCWSSPAQMQFALDVHQCCHHLYQSLAPVVKYVSWSTSLQGCEDALCEPQGVPETLQPSALPSVHLVLPVPPRASLWPRVWPASCFVFSPDQQTRKIRCCSSFLP